MYAATGGQNMKWGTYFKWGADTTGHRRPASCAAIVGPWWQNFWPTAKQFCYTIKRT